MSESFGHLDANKDDKEDLFMRLAFLSAPDDVIADAGGDFARLSGFEWKTIFDLALTSGVLPSVFNKALRLYERMIPDDVLQIQRVRLSAIAGRNVFLLQRLFEVVEFLESKGIAVVPFKGPVLAQKAYGDIAGRQFEDLDLIIERNDLSRAYALLISQGYKEKEHLSPREVEHQIRGGWGVALVSSDGSYQVDINCGIHHSFQDISGLNEQAIWADAEWQDLGGKKIRSISNEQELMMLCVHASKHCWERLSWVCDVTGYIRRNRINLGLLLSDSCRYTVSRMVLVGLCLSRDVHGTILPTEIENMIKCDGRVATLAGESIDLMCCGVDISSARELRYTLQLRESICDMVSYMSGLVFAPTLPDLRMFTLPRYLSFVYFISRPFRLLLSRSKKIFIAV